MAVTDRQHRRPARPPTTRCDVAADQGRLPAPRRDHARQAPSSTSTRPPRRRSRSVVLDAMDHYYETTNANVHRGVYADRRGRPPTRWRPPAPRSPASSAPRRPPRSSSPRTPPRRFNLRGPLVGPRQPRPGRRRRCSPSSSTTPTSSRGRSWPPRRASRSAGSRSTADGQLDLTDLDRLLDGAKLLGLTAMSQRARHHHPGPPRSPTPPTPPAPWCASTPASTCRTSPPTSADLGADFARLLRPQDVRAHRHRRALGPRGAARRHAAVPRRRRDDPRRRARRLHRRTSCPGSSRPARRRSPRSIGLRRRGRLPRRASAWTPCASTRSSLTAYALRTLTERFGDQLTIHGPAEPAAARRRALVRPRRPAPPRPLPGARRARRVRPRRPPLRQAAHARARRRRHCPRLVLRLQRRARRRRAGRRARRRRRVVLRRL